MEEYILGNFDTLPPEMIMEMLERLPIKSAVRLCATNKPFRQWCKDFNVLERMAKKELKRLNPYSIPVSPLNILAYNQQTVYLVSNWIQNVYEIKLFQPTFNDVWTSVHEFSDDWSFLTLPGLRLRPGNYWILSSLEFAGLEPHVITTKEEYEEAKREYLDSGRTFTQFFERFEREGGLSQPLGYYHYDETEVQDDSWAIVMRHYQLK